MTQVLADNIDGEPMGKVNFVLRDSRDRIWITVSTTHQELDACFAHRSPDGYMARYKMGNFASSRMDFISPTRSEWMHAKSSCIWSRLPAGCVSGCGLARMAA